MWAQSSWVWREQTIHHFLKWNNTLICKFNSLTPALILFEIMHCTNQFTCELVIFVFMNYEIIFLWLSSSSNHLHYTATSKSINYTNFKSLPEIFPLSSFLFTRKTSPRFSDIWDQRETYIMKVPRSHKKKMILNLRELLIKYRLTLINV